MQNLTLKYRPTLLDDVVGQAETVSILKQLLNAPIQPPLIILQGAYGSGKTTLARIYSYMVMGLESYDDLDICPDFSEFDAASNGNVEAIREILDIAITYPILSKYRVFLIDEAHVLSTAAQRALLKSLEDGVGKSLFILATTEAEKLLPTIISRGVTLNISTFTNEDICNRLSYICQRESIEYTDADLESIAVISQGHMRDAVKYLDMYSTSGILSIPESANPYTLAKNIIFGDSDISKTNIKKAINLYNASDLYDFMHRFFLKIVMDIDFALFVGSDKAQALRLELFFNRLGYISHTTFIVDVEQARQSISNNGYHVGFGRRMKKTVKEIVSEASIEVDIDTEIKQGILKAIKELQVVGNVESL